MSESSTILGLDPSSTCIGWGALTPDAQLRDAGIIRPNKAAEGSFERIVTMHTDLWSLFEQVGPAVIVVEWTKGKVQARHKGLGAGLAVYGAGVGAAGLAAWLWAQGHVGCRAEAVLENDWTRGVPKSTRRRAVAEQYPAYGAHLSDDPGGDMADGIGIAEWWIREQRIGKGLSGVSAEIQIAQHLQIPIETLDGNAFAR